MKYLKTILITLIAALLVGFLGCSSIQNIVTPCYIDPDIGEYTGENMTSWLPWTSIWDADRLAAKMEFLHSSNLIELQRAAENDTRYYGHLTEALILNREVAAEFRNNVFSPSGPGGLLVSMLPAFGLGAFLVSKPGDKKKIVELEHINGTKANS